MAGKWIFIDLDSECDLAVLEGAGDGKTLFECEITFQLRDGGEYKTADWWLNALQSGDLKSPTIEIHESAGTVSIHFAETVTRPACWFFSVERAVLEAFSSHAEISVTQDAFIKHGRVRRIPRGRLLLWRA